MPFRRAGPGFVIVAVISAATMTLFPQTTELMGVPSDAGAIVAPGIATFLSSVALVMLATPSYRASASYGMWVVTVWASAAFLFLGATQIGLHFAGAPGGERVLALVVLAPGLVLWVTALVRVMREPSERRVSWFLTIILTGPIGALAYLLLRRGVLPRDARSTRRA